MRLSAVFVKCAFLFLIFVSSSAHASSDDIQTLLKGIGDAHVKHKMCQYKSMSDKSVAVQECVSACADLRKFYNADVKNGLAEAALLAAHAPRVQKCEAAYEAVQGGSPEAAAAPAPLSAPDKVERPENGWSFQQRVADLSRKADNCKSNEWVSKTLTRQQMQSFGNVKSCEGVCNSQGQIATQFVQTKLSETDASEALKRVVSACEDSFYAYTAYVEKAKPESPNYYELMPIKSGAEGVEVADQHYSSCIKRGFAEQICKCTTNKIIEGLNNGMGKSAWRLGDIPLKRGVCTQN